VPQEDGAGSGADRRRGGTGAGTRRGGRPACSDGRPPAPRSPVPRPFSPRSRSARALCAGLGARGGCGGGRGCAV